VNFELKDTFWTSFLLFVTTKKQLFGFKSIEYPGHFSKINAYIAF